MIRVIVHTGSGNYTEFQHSEADFYTTPEDGYLHLYAGGKHENDSPPVVTYQKNTWIRVSNV